MLHGCPGTQQHCSAQSVLPELHTWCCNLEMSTFCTPCCIMAFSSASAACGRNLTPAGGCTDMLQSVSSVQQWANSLFACILPLLALHRPSIAAWLHALLQGRPACSTTVLMILGIRPYCRLLSNLTRTWSQQASMWDKCFSAQARLD